MSKLVYSLYKYGTVCWHNSAGCTFHGQNSEESPVYCCTTDVLVQVFNERKNGITRYLLPTKTKKSWTTALGLMERESF